jgi:hypothetical protein
MNKKTPINPTFNSVDYYTKDETDALITDIVKGTYHLKSNQLNLSGETKDVCMRYKISCPSDTSILFGSGYLEYVYNESYETITTSDLNSNYVSICDNETNLPINFNGFNIFTLNLTWSQRTFHIPKLSDNHGANPHFLNVSINSHMLPSIRYYNGFYNMKLHSDDADIRNDSIILFYMNNNQLNMALKVGFKTADIDEFIVGMCFSYD